MKRLLAGVLVLLLLAVSAGCGRLVEEGAGSVPSEVTGDVLGELGAENSTKWFDFTVLSIQAYPMYEGLEAGYGYKFIDAVVSVTNTFGEPIPMSCWDFELAAENLPEEDSYAIGQLDDTCMPEDFMLGVDESVRCRVLFTVPSEVYEFSFIYEEIDWDDNVGATYTVHHSLYNKI